MIGFDTETHLIRRGYATPRMVCLTAAGRAWDDVPDWVEGADWWEVRPYGWSCLWTRATAAAGIRHLLEAPDLLVAHNAAFDLRVLAAAWDQLMPGRSGWALARILERLDRDPCGVADTEHRERLHRLAVGEYEWTSGPGGRGAARTSYSLAATWARYTGQTVEGKGEDSWRLRYSELDGVPIKEWPEEAIAYAVMDAAYARDLYQIQADLIPAEVDGYRLRDGDRVVSEDREVRSQLALDLMAAWGLRTDPEAVDQVVGAWRALAEEGRQVGRDQGWIRVKGRDKGRPDTLCKAAIQAAVSAAYASAGTEAPRTPPSKTYPEGQVRYAEDVLVEAASLASPDAPETHPLHRYAETLQAQNWATKYGPILELGTSTPITSRPNSLVMTGRTSWSDPPLQQPPRKGGFRSCFVPRSGYLFCSVDYDTIELCALAQVLIWLGLGTRMADAINRGHDLHRETGRAIAEAEGYRWEDLSPDDQAAYRQRGKVANFGFPGGLGARTFTAYAKGQGLRLDIDQAETIREAWLARWPEMRGYFRLVSDRLAYVDSFTAVQPVSHRLRGGCRYTNGCNTYFQGLVADGAKAAAWRLARESYAGAGPLRGVRPVLFLHDEIVAEVPAPGAPEAAEAMATLMVEVMQRHIPDVRVTAEPALMERWYKSAETVRDARGRLVPWAPEGGTDNE